MSWGLCGASVSRPTGKRADAAIGDFDGNGHPDVAIGSIYQDEPDVLVGDGAGRWSPSHTLVTGRFARAVAAGDFNEDGRDDIVVSNAMDTTGKIFDLSILLTRSGGGFLPPAYYALPTGGTGSSRATSTPTDTSTWLPPWRARPSSCASRRHRPLFEPDYVRTQWLGRRVGGWRLQ